MARVTATDELAILNPGPDFDERVRALMPGLLAYFLRRVTPSADSADCLSETLVVLWRRRADIPRDDDAARAWSFGVARGVLSNQRRGRLRQAHLSDALKRELATFAPPTDDITLAVRDALTVLPEKDREMLTLVVWDGFGVAEAGAVLGLKPAAARARYSRARSRMRESLA